MDSRKCMKPIRMWIDGKSFNIKKYDKKNLTKYQPDSSKVSKPKTQKERLYCAKFHLPSSYYIKLDRFKDPQINAVELETSTSITYPKHGKDGVIEISGDTEESVETAREQLHSFIAEIRSQFSALQFIAIPLLSEEIKNNFAEFKKAILEENHQGVEESLFQSALKLHLTVVVFTLLSEEEKQEAIRTLEECKNNIFQTKTTTPMKIKVKGLNCMNDNFSKVNVLYAEATSAHDTESERSLQEIVNSISDTFYEKGFTRESKNDVKLHMTLLNTKYRNKKEGSPKKHWVKRIPFDATKIMEQYKDYYFGEAAFDTIHLSLMSTKGEDGFYECLATIKI